MIKLKNILLNENNSRYLYEDSIESALSNYKISKSKDDAGFTTFSIKDWRGNLVGKFCRFITNNQLNQIEECEGPVHEIIKNHDLEFSKKNRLKLRK